MAINSGADVTMANICQLFNQSAIHGNAHDAHVKNNAIDMFATNVRYLGPTYSNTIINN